MATPLPTTDSALDSSLPRVTITRGPGAGTSYYLNEAELVIGRGAGEADGLVALVDPTVSRAHARLVRGDEGYHLEDLGSANGTALNYTRLGEPRLLADGDLIKVGGTMLVYRTPVAAPAMAAARAEGRIVTLFSLKGGVGRTTLAVNLALRLRALTGEAVLLIDLSLEQAAAANHLNLSVRRGIDDLAQLEAAAAEGLRWVTAHHSSGLDVLPAPPSPEHAERIGGDLIGHLVPALRARYRWIVVDTAPTFSDVNLSLFDHTDWLLHVTAADVPALRSLQSALGVFERLGQSVGERRLVLNGIHAQTKLDRARIEDTLGRRIDLAVPHSEAVLDSLDRGVPLALSAPTDPVNQALDGWIRQVADVKAAAPVAERGGRGFWPRLRPAAARAQVAV
jgi:Flp pilus assembly CpaE family ATPase